MTTKVRRYCLEANPTKTTRLLCFRIDHFNYFSDMEKGWTDFTID